MNSNLFHNIANIAMVVLSAVTAALMATGCVTLPDGSLDCTTSWLNPAWTTFIVAGLGVLKLVVNVFRDGLAGLFKKQPPVV